MIDVTPRERSVVLTLNNRTNKSQHEIFAIIGVNPSTVSRILKRIQTGGISRPKKKRKCERKRKKSPRSEAALIRVRNK